MSRYVSATNQTESEKPSVTMCLLVTLDFASGPLNVHDGLGNLVDTFASPAVTYIGVGSFGSVDGTVNDSLELIARPLKLSLSGVDSAVIAAAMETDYQGRSITLSKGYLQNGALIAAPAVVWEGRMDYMEISFGHGAGSISVNCEHRLRKEPRIARYTSEDQQIAHAGDTFFDLVPFIAGFKSQWGDKPSQFSTNNDLLRDFVWRFFNRGR